VLYHQRMAEHLSLIVLILALATGLVTSIVSVTYLQGRQPEFFRYFLTNILLFNLLILAGLVFRYLQLRFQADDLTPPPFVLPGILIVMAAVKLGWLYAFILMNKTLPADVAPYRRRRLLAIAAVVVFLGYFGVTAVASFLRYGFLNQTVIMVLETLIIGGALCVTLQLMFTAIKLGGGDRRKSILMFGGYHLCLFGIILATLVMGWLQPGPQKLVQIIANGGFLILFNVFPLLWIKWFRPLQPVSNLERFELLGITKREREIVMLIKSGKTNQEIADELFISVATVKDHNHNLFRKSGVRNRLELANLFP
jgi:DNA-binding CsgD family transcriptional regulator